MTERPGDVRFAIPSDGEAVLGLMLEAYKEQPTFKLSEQKMRDKIRLCTNVPEGKGFIGIIGKPENLEGYIIATVSTYWYTDEPHIEELSNFVHPDFRNPGGHARKLIDFAKWVAEQFELPLLLGILSTKRLEPKIRLYQRQAKHCGAIFIHNSQHAEGLLSGMG
jgi:hypothetical protein